MELKQLNLSNLGRFKALEMSLAPTEAVKSNVTVLIGINGSGKTTILTALAISLSWLSARIRSEKGNGALIAEESILNRTPSAAIKLSLQEQREYSWELAKSRPGNKGTHTSQLQDITQLADQYRSLLTANPDCSLPLIAFYPVERSVLDIPLKIKSKHSFSQLDGYENSLNHGVDFRRFFEWFREREDIENEVVNNNLLRLIDDDSMTSEEHFALTNDSQLNAVRNAIMQFMPGFTNLKVRRKPRLHMSIDKAGETLNVAQLSQGEKSLMALVGDIARRLAMLNPGLKNPLHGNGVVLIDEVDMHLHPQWARSIIERLSRTFPNCQFVLTTHSPLVISDCKDVLVYALDDGNLTVVPSQYGQDANTVLLEVMDTPVRNAEVEEQLGDLFDLIQNQQWGQAKAKLAAMEKELPPQNLELSKAKLLLRKEVLRHAEN